VRAPKAPQDPPVRKVPPAPKGQPARKVLRDRQDPLVRKGVPGSKGLRAHKAREARLARPVPRDRQARRVRPGRQAVCATWKVPEMLSRASGDAIACSDGEVLVSAICKEGPATLQGLGGAKCGTATGVVGLCMRK
jgi:hypothetical protein